MSKLPCTPALAGLGFSAPLFGVVIRPPIHVPLELRALLDTMLSQRIMPRAQTIFIRVAAHPMRTGITWGIGL